MNKFKQLTCEDTVTGGSCILFCRSRAAAEDLGKEGLYEITPALYNVT